MQRAASESFMASSRGASERAVRLRLRCVRALTGMSPEGGRFPPGRVRPRYMACAQAKLCPKTQHMPTCPHPHAACSPERPPPGQATQHGRRPMCSTAVCALPSRLKRRSRAWCPISAVPPLADRRCAIIQSSSHRDKRHAPVRRSRITVRRKSNTYQPGSPSHAEPSSSSSSNHHRRSGRSPAPNR